MKTLGGLLLPTKAQSLIGPVLLPAFFMVGRINQTERIEMKCLRRYATSDGESRFDKVELPTTKMSVHPDAVPFSRSHTSRRV
jgi:hypothetical protein